MKEHLAPHHIFLAVLGLIALALVSCGGNEDLAKKMGCPTGSILANSDDLITSDLSDAQNVGFQLGPQVGGIPIGGGFSMGFVAPLKFTVWPPTGGVKKNNICILLTTNGFLWDFPGGTNQGGYFVTKTDDSGSVTVWFSTQAMASSATVSGTTAGADVSGENQVAAYSGGAAQAAWNVSFTVQGCRPDQGAFCP